MEITTQERTKELKPYKLNQELFDLLKGSDYEALKRDIKKKGVKVELHILPDKTVICGHQRLRIAKELGISHLRCKTVTDLDTAKEIREYVILDNLLRRQLTPEKQAFLLDDLSKQYEIGRGGDHKSKDFKELNMGSLNNNVLSKTAQKVNVSKNTVQRARAYVKAVKTNPVKYNGKSISAVLRAEKVRKNTIDIEEKQEKMKLDGIFKTIVIDPPWEHYGVAWGYQRREKPDYATMSIENIDNYIQQKVISHIDKDAHIYLWVINARLHDGLHLLEKWGFVYKTMITWCKPQMGMGQYFRNNTEHLLFAVKGSLSLKRQDIHTYFISDRTKHSVKPDVAYNIIEKASYPPYVDVFSRRKRKNWFCIGEVNG